MTEPHWTQVLAALLTPTIAVFGSLIAYQQWQTAKKKLKLDLFEKRFSVYIVARDFVTTVMTHGKAKDEEMYKFVSGTREAKWLFNSEICTYLDDNIWDYAVELQTLNAELEGVPVGDERTKNVQRQGEIKKLLYAQYGVLDKKLAPYLQLEH